MQIEHKKNTAYYLSFPMVDSTTPASFKVGLSPADAAYYKDGAGAWTSLAITDTAAEIGSTGVYEITLSSTEMNHDQVMIKLTGSGAADTAFLFDMRTKLVDDLNDIAATAIVSGGAIDTTAGAVDNVTLTATTTTNTDMRGTDSAATAANLATAQGNITDILADTNELQTDDVPGLIAALNDLSAAQVNAECDTAIGDAALATAANLATVDTVVDGIQADLSNATDGLGALKTLIDALPANADVLTQINTALDTAISELGVATPSATPTIRTGLMLMYMALRNKTVVQTSGTDALEIYNDAGTKIASKLITDDGSDYTEAEMT